MTIDISEVKTVDGQLFRLKERLQKMVVAEIKSLAYFMEVENELDMKKNEGKTESGRRRKAHSYKNFEFQGLSYRTIAEDLNAIYEGTNDDEGFGPENFKRNDLVSCVVDRKKYKGVVISVSQKGMVIKTQDRRKIRISWEDIEDEDIKVVKIQNDNE